MDTTRTPTVFRADTVTATATNTVSLLNGQGLPHHDICVLCGTILHAHQDRRSKTVRNFSAMLTNRWKPTPYTWRSIQSICQNAKSDQERLTSCTACINWMRRSVPSNECAGQRAWDRSLLLIDRLICFSMAPGEVTSPDLRNMRRLIKCLKHRETIQGMVFTNYYLSILPPHLALTLEESRHETVDDVFDFVHLLIRRWWEQVSNRCPFFRNPDTAYLVRKALSGHRIKLGGAAAPAGYDPEEELPGVDRRDGDDEDLHLRAAKQARHAEHPE